MISNLSSLALLPCIKYNSWTCYFQYQLIIKGSSPKAAKPSHITNTCKCKGQRASFKGQTNNKNNGKLGMGSRSRSRIVSQHRVQCTVSFVGLRSDKGFTLHGGGKYKCKFVVAWGGGWRLHWHWYHQTKTKGKGVFCWPDKSQVDRVGG